MSHPAQAEPLHAPLDQPVQLGLLAAHLVGLYVLVLLLVHHLHAELVGVVIEPDLVVGAHLLSCFALPSPGGKRMIEQEDEDPVLPPLGQLHVVVNPLPPANCVQSDFVDPVKLDHLSQDQAHLLAPVATAEHLRAAAEVPDEVFQW